MTAIKVRPTVREDKLVCALCQSWSGVRSFNARTGFVEFDNSSLNCTKPCAMKYKRSGFTPAVKCRGFVLWCELG